MHKLKKIAKLIMDLKEDFDNPETHSNRNLLGGSAAVVVELPYRAEKEGGEWCEGGLRDGESGFRGGFK